MAKSSLAKFNIAEGSDAEGVRVTGFFFLYFTACMVGAADTCDTKRIPLDVPTARACIRVAQPQLARWVEEHPKYRITAYRCGAPPNDPHGGTRI